ncbi:MAG TPA: DUF4328 domain-containing protein [Acidimicrobiales bacterium]|nr:DUF4328 domain-containing protein [Acidimicrobiales bacterium]
MHKWAGAAVWAWAVVAVGQLVGFFAMLGTLRSNLRTVWHDATSQHPASLQSLDLSNLAGVTRLLDVGGMVFAALGVVFLVWQHDAAKVARGLGYPARISPGLGVGSWFIPIANLFLPYWSLRDCLPPGHPMRSKALWAWLGYVATGLLGGTTYVTALFSVVDAIVPLLGTVACVAVAASLGYRLVLAVEHDHTRALAALGR